MNWNDLKYYLAVARSGNLSEAARLLDVSPSTVSRRIDALEQTLGVPLFARRPDGYLLNEAGHNLLPAAEQAEAQLLLLQRGATSSELDTRGVVRVAVPELLGQYLIIPQLHPLQASYPEIRLELITDVRPMPLSTREADIVIRLNRPTQGDYTLRQIGQLSQALYASSDYLQLRGTPSTSADLAEHQLIGWDKELSYLPLARWLEEQLDQPDLYLRTSSYHAQLMAVRSGIGIAALPRFAAEMFELQPVVLNHPPLMSDIWLIKQAESARLKRVQIVAEQLTSIISSSRDQLL
ncbi:LysR family transcriptional regulator [Marinobacterium maritimum]|uniref:LysR family transcriptional regulator n=1 Tax=Marinobacterium maritimum TaxID=500162 RepID=A0ABP3TBM7_9GAMM